MSDKFYEDMESLIDETDEESGFIDDDFLEDYYPEKKNIWGRLFIVVVVLIVVLLGVFIFLFARKTTKMDISDPYKPTGISASEYMYGDTFAKNLVVCDPSVTIEGVKLSFTKEKALLFNIDSNEALFAQGIYDKAYPASITKLMTAILAAKYGNMSDEIIMEASDFYLEEGSQVSGLRLGDKVTLEQLFYALVVYSANDAANAIARYLDGSIYMFTERMNMEAKSLGMSRTHFVNPHGLHDKDHYTCAYDVYIMMQEALKYPAFVDAMRLNMYQLKVNRPEGTIVYELSSTDNYVTGAQQLPAGVTVFAGKTGTTDEAGSCLALTVQNVKGVPYIAVVLGAQNKENLYKDMTQLLNHVND